MTAIIYSAQTGELRARRQFDSREDAEQWLAAELARLMTPNQYGWSPSLDGYVI